MWLWLLWVYSWCCWFCEWELWLSYCCEPWLSYWYAVYESCCWEDWWPYDVWLCDVWLYGERSRRSYS